MTDEKYRALVEQSFQLNELTNHPGWPVLVDYMLTVVLKPRKDRILNGNLDSLDEYKRIAGFCQGSEWVLNAHQIIANAVLEEQGRRNEAEQELAVK